MGDGQRATHAILSGVQNPLPCIAQLIGSCNQALLRGQVLIGVSRHDNLLVIADESFFTMAGQTDEEGGSDGDMDASADSGHSDDDHDMAEADDDERMKEVLQASSR